MDKMKMQTNDLADENFKKLKELFPNAVTETKDENGNVVRAIDKDVLRQEISVQVVEGPDERYQFTWPGKRESIRLAAAPITAALRPCREESVNFDTTRNVYIEGDNLDVLKLLRETYLGKVKMIYIDPPYNTGNDFIYEDDFKEDRNDFFRRDNQYDDQGNRLVQNTESNGSFHTDWLNMIYPRLKVAKYLLQEDGAIFISIDDNEVENLKKVCNEVFGKENFRNAILVRRRIKSLNSQFSESGLSTMNVAFEYVLVYAKSNSFLMKALKMKKSQAPEKGRWDVFWSNADRPTMRYDILGFTPSTGQWRNSKEKAYKAVQNYEKYLETSSSMSLEEYSQKTGITDFIRRLPNGTGKNGGVQHWIPPLDTSLRTSNWSDIEVSQIGKEIQLPFDNPKSKQLLTELIKLSNVSDGDIILDFFSGSATTAHATMQINAEDSKKRKFVLVQLPEPCAEESDAYKAGFKNICEIGKERIRRAGKMIKDENPLAAKNLDIGFRVFKLDSSNMKDVYYSPSETPQSDLLGRVDNIKDGRTPEDLLFQVMLEFGIPLSSKIKESVIAGKKVFNVEDNYLIACFDDNVTEETIAAIAKEKPQYVVLRDSGFKTDSVASNFEQIFATYSPDTTRRVL